MGRPPHLVLHNYYKERLTRGHGKQNVNSGRNAAYVGPFGGHTHVKNVSYR
jgi:hypothetical protein